MEKHTNQENQKTYTSKNHIIVWAISLCSILTAPQIANAQENKNIENKEQKTAINLVSDTTKIENYLIFAKEMSKKYFPERQAYFEKIINYTQEDEYIAANINAFLKRTVDKIPDEKNKAVATLLLIHVINTDDKTKAKENLREMENIDLSKAGEIELKNALNIRYSRAEQYLYHGKTKIEAPKKTNYLESVRLYIKDKYPEEIEYYTEVLKTIEEDEYIGNNVNMLISRATENLNDKDKMEASAEMIDMIASDDKDRELFFERQEISISKEVNDACEDFMKSFKKWGKSYIKFSKKRRKF